MKFKGFILLGLLFAVLLVSSALAAETSKREQKANEVKDTNDAAKSIQVDTEQMEESDQAVNQAAEKYSDIGGYGGDWSGGYGWGGRGGGGGYGWGRGGRGGGGYGGSGGGHCRFGCCGGYGRYGCWRCC